METCARCEKELPPPNGTAAGYGISEGGKKHCYDCCAAIDLQRAIASGKWTGYITEYQNSQGNQDSQLSGPKSFYSYKITNWPGSLSFEVIKVYKGKHNIGRTRLDAWFRMPGDPFVWPGVQIGDYNQIIRARRTKRKTA